MGVRSPYRVVRRHLMRSRQQYQQPMSVGVGVGVRNLNFNFWGRMTDILLGEYRWCWRVTADDHPVGYLCEDYPMFRELILYTEIDPGSNIRVARVWARYKRPRIRAPELLARKMERERERGRAGHTVQKVTKKRSRRRKSVRWHVPKKFGRGGRH